MKKYIILVLTVATTAVFAQTIRRVNNNPGVTGVNVYSSLQAAHDAASSNDVLLIEPSNTSYGNLTATKPLKIYGNGHFLWVNTELKADTRSSIVETIRFNTGSGGSELYGVAATQVIHVHGVSNVKIIRCMATSGGVNLTPANVANTTSTNISNIQIVGNYMNSVTVNAAAGYTISNVLVSNNILHNLVAETDPVIQNWVVRNNTFFSNNYLKLVNGILENNIFSAGTQTFLLTNVTASYNVAGNTLFSSGNGNQNNYAVAAEHIGAGTGISEDEAYMLKPGSPLKTAGSGGTEVGAFGGTTPYVVSAVPPIPSITGMVNSATGSNATPLQVTISVKANN